MKFFNRIVENINKRPVISLMVLLLLIAMLVSSIRIIRERNEEREERIHFATTLVWRAKGISVNADNALREDAESFEASMIGVKFELEMLINELQSRAHHNEIIHNGYIVVNSVYGEYMDIFKNFSDSGLLTDSDYVFLGELRDIFEEFRGSLQNEDDSLKRQAGNESDLLERLSILNESLLQFVKS